MSTIAPERSFHNPEADYAGLLANDPQLVDRLREAVSVREQRKMFNVSAFVLSSEASDLTEDQLVAPYRLMAEERNDTRASNLLEAFNIAYQHKDDQSMLWQISDVGDRLSRQRTRELRMFLPAEYKAQTAAMIAAGRQLLQPYETPVSAAPADSKHVSDADVSSMIDEATAFLRQTAPVVDRPATIARQEEATSTRVRDTIAVTLKSVTARLTTEELKNWAKQAQAMLEPVTNSNQTEYEFYQVDNDTPDPDAIIYAKIESLVERLAAKVEQLDPKKLVATVAALVALGATAPSLTPTAPKPVPKVAQLAAVERKAAAAVLNLANDKKASVHFGAAAKQYMQAAANGEKVIPENTLTTAAEVTSAATTVHTPVMIEAVTTVATAGHAASEPALVVHPASIAGIAKLYDQFSHEHAATLLVDPARLPSGGAELLDGAVVSKQVAAAALGNESANIIVNIDPLHPANVVTTAQSKETTTSTAAVPESTTVSGAHPEHVFDPTNALDVLYLTLSNYRYGSTGTDKLSEQDIFAIMAQARAEGRNHPGTLENEPPGVYMTIESLPQATLYNTNIGYGLFQWTPAIKLLNTAKVLGVDPDTVSGQVAVLMHDLQQTDIKNPAHTYLHSITAAPDLQAACDVMENHWERPSGYTDRYPFAVQAMYYIKSNIAPPYTMIPLTPAELGSKPVPMPTTTSVAPTTSTTSTTLTSPPTPNTTPSSTSGADTQWLAAWTAQQAQTSPATTPESSTASSTSLPATTSTTAPAAAPAVVWPFPTKSDQQIFPTNSLSHLDQGLDIQQASGQPVVAVADGTVSVGNPDPGGFGDDYPELMLDKPIGGPSNTIYYGHTHTVPSVIGKHVVQGEIIGYTNVGPDPSAEVDQNGSVAFPGWDEIGYAKDGTDEPVDNGAGATPAGQQMYALLRNAPVASTITPPPAP
jgi:hypothetical protein